MNLRFPEGYLECYCQKFIKQFKPKKDENSF